MSRPLVVLTAFLVLSGCGRDATDPPVTGVESTVPAANAVDASVAGVIAVRYAGDVVLPASAAPSALLVLRASDTVPGTVVLKDGRVLEFTPSDILEFGTRYTVQVSSSLRSASGAALAPHTWSFTTGGRALPEPDAARMLADVQTLAHDSLRGRGSGTQDELRAARVVLERMQNAGLAPLSGAIPFQTFTTSNVTSQNVYHLLRGRGTLADEYVIVGAHYDHIGVTAAGINNGADDNASGTAGMLELARLMAAHASSGGFGAEPRRSVLFIAFGAEERGLYGSNWYCANALVPLARTAGMINLDMIGRQRGDSVQVYGTSSSATWAPLLQRYRGALRVSMPPGTVGTDYRCFVAAGHPAVALFTGLHEDYHRPTDDVERINAPGMVAVSRIALGLATNLMLRPQLRGSSQSP